MSTLVVSTLKTTDGAVSVDVNKIPQAIGAEYFGAKCDGVSDDTAALQRALDEGVIVLLPAGTIITGPLVFKSGSGLIGKGAGSTKLKALTSSQTRIVTLTGTDCTLEGVALEGAGTTVVGDWRNGLLSVVSASDFSVRDVNVSNAPNLGAMFYNCSKGAKNSHVENLTVSNTGWKGIVVLSPCSDISLRNIEQYNSINIHGISYEPYDWSNKGNIYRVNIENAYIHDNSAGFGLYTFGLVTGSSWDDFGYTFNEQMVQHCKFKTIITESNFTGAVAGGSYCTYEDISAKGNSGSSGIVINGHRSNYAGINSTGNKTYGIDVGGASYCNVSNFNLTQNNPAGDFCIALNVGGSIGCVIENGVIADNGANNSSCTSIVLSGREGDGTYAYSQGGAFNRISNIYLQGQSNQYAIRAWRGDSCSVIENIMMNGFNVSTCVQDRTVNTNTPTMIRNVVAPATTYPGGVNLPSANALVIPDHAEFVYITGTTSIGSIKTATEADFSGKVNDVIVTSFGSGYKLTDTVVFSGDGTGASGHLDIARASGEAVVSVIVDNPGSGYTNCSVSITSSTGSGFAGTVILGAVNCKERVVTLFFESPLSIQVSGMNSAFSANAGSTLTLKRMQNGTWAELARAS